MVLKSRRNCLSDEGAKTDEIYAESIASIVVALSQINDMKRKKKELKLF